MGIYASHFEVNGAEMRSVDAGHDEFFVVGVVGSENIHESELPRQKTNAKCKIFKI